ncbi:ABC transporter permease, partial [Neisseria meningitidis]
PVAWVLARLAVPRRALVQPLLTLPFLMPTLVAGVGRPPLLVAERLLRALRPGLPYPLVYVSRGFYLSVLLKLASLGGVPV